MDKKAAYLLSSGVVIIFVLLISLIYHNKGSESQENQFVQVELESPEDVKGVFKNIYIVKKEEKHEAEEYDMEDVEEDAHDKAEEAHEDAQEGAVEEVVQEGIIKMEEPSYKHKKPIVAFTHLTHIEKYQIKCGDCHHDDAGAPLQDITLESAVDKCFACHDKPGEKPKGKDAPKLTPEEELAYHAEALHQNCIECHKKSNKETGKKTAPTSCSKCHAK
ncbi:MAG: cytochrome c3 family protein [Deltaproteobacteria bacterium]|nr:cytochrome c3 family protein [Deltaproteobacteria bacterium]